MARVISNLNQPEKTSDEEQNVHIVTDLYPLLRLPSTLAGLCGRHFAKHWEKAIILVKRHRSFPLFLKTKDLCLFKPTLMG